jgi:phosphohistidine phosphatase
MSESLRVLVVRHAIAEERDARRWPDDSLRPLTTRGERRFAAALPGVATLVDEPDEVWSSPLRRARQTADLGERIAGWPKARVVDALSPGVPPLHLGRTLQARRGGRDAPALVAVVGHEPGLGRFLAWCVGARSAGGLSLRKGGAALLRFDAEVSAGSAHLDWIATPRMLRALGRGGR